MSMDRIKEFIVKRRAPVSVEDICKRFLVSKTTAQKAASALLNERMVEVIYGRSTKGRLVRTYRGIR